MNELPRKWTLSKIGDVAESIQYGYTASAKPSGKTRFLRITDIQNGRVGWENVPYCDIPDEEYEKYALKKDDIVFVRTGATVGKSFIIEDVEHRSVFASYLIRITAKKDVIPRYIKYFFNSPLYWSQIYENAAGIGQPSFNSSKLANIVFPLAPLPEQKRIVAKLDTLFAHLDQLRARLDKIPVLLKQFRQAVLTQAVTGKLTEEWRGRNPMQESGRQLLARIEKEIREEYEKACELHKKGNSAKPKIPRGYKEGVNYGREKTLYDLPPSWARTVIDKIGSVFVGSTPSRKTVSYWDGNIPWVSSGEVANNRIDSTNERISEDGLANSSAKLLPKGTVLIAMIGEGKTRGQSAILAIDACTNQNVAAIVTLPAQFVPDYLWYYLLSSYAENRGQGRGGNQPALNGQKVGEICINVPPLIEQREIVYRIEALFGLANEVQTRYEALRRKADRIPEIILSKVFRGGLALNESKEYSQQRDSLLMASES